MVLDGGAAGLSAVVSEPTPEEAALARTLATAPGRFEAVFQEIHAARMKGVPFVNGSLSVKAVGFRIHEGRVIGVLVTPWFMNIILLPGVNEDWSGLPTGTRELLEFPSGIYEFLSAERPETGPYKACSLFSPMFDFSSMLQAVETAEAVIPALLDPANREEGSRSGEIRRRAEEDAARREEQERATSERTLSERALSEPASPEAGSGEAAGAPTALSRRAMIFGPGLAAKEEPAPAVATAHPQAQEP